MISTLEVGAQGMAVKNNGMSTQVFLWPQLTVLALLTHAHSVLHT